MDAQLNLYIEMLCFRALRRFSQMKYYKEMASFLKIKVPIINQDIQIQDNKTCLIHGLKKIEAEQKLVLQGQIASREEVQKIKLAQTQQKKSEKDISQAMLAMPQPLYIYDKYSKQSIPFSKALQISKMLKMDVSLMRYGPQGSQPTLTLTTFRKNVYTQYYIKYIKRRGTSGFKNIRLGQRIQDNDIKTKKSNIDRMLKQGQRRFKLIAQNDSDRSEKVIIEFAKFFQKQVQPYITTIRSSRGKLQQKWSANLIFDDQLDINIDQINKKWRRKCYQQSRQQMSKQEEQAQLQKLFSDEDIRMEREMFHTYKELGMKMPKRFQKMADQEKLFGADKMALFRSVLKAEEEGEVSEEWDDDEEQQFKSKMQKSNKEYFGERSVTEIIEQMQTLKKSGYESQAHKVARFRQLKQQLQNIVRKSEKSQI